MLRAKIVDLAWTAGLHNSPFHKQRRGHDVEKGRRAPAERHGMTMTYGIDEVLSFRSERAGVADLRAKMGIAAAYFRYMVGIRVDVRGRIGTLKNAPGVEHFDGVHLFRVLVRKPERRAPDTVEGMRNDRYAALPFDLFDDFQVVGRRYLFI